MLCAENGCVSCGELHSWVECHVSFSSRGDCAPDDEMGCSLYFCRNEFVCGLGEVRKALKQPAEALLLCLLKDVHAIFGDH